MADPEVRILAASRLPAVDRRVTAIDRTKLSRGSYIRRMLSEAHRYDVTLVDGATGARSLYDDQILAGVLARRGHRVLLFGCYWEPGSRQLSRLFGDRPIVGTDLMRWRGESAFRWAISARDHPNLHYTVLSSWEKRIFPSMWNVEPHRVHFLPYWATDTRRPSDLVRSSDGPTVFCGGNSARDYRPILAAAPFIDTDIFIATELDMPHQLPDNVTVRAVTPAEYSRLMHGALIQIVPLLALPTRSAGQKTYLNAMALGQPVVAFDVPGVRDHIEHGRTGFVVSPEPGQLAELINKLVADHDLVDQVGQAAKRAVAERYTAEHYARRLYGLAASIVAPR